MAAAREPQTAVLTKTLMEEAKRDGPRLAQALFGDEAVAGHRRVPKRELLAFYRHANENGLMLPTGFVPPQEWGAREIQRVGYQGFWDTLHAAYGLSAADGLRLAREQLAAAPQTPMPPAQPEQPDPTEGE